MHSRSLVLVVCLVEVLVGLACKFVKDFLSHFVRQLPYCNLGNPVIKSECARPFVQKKVKDRDVIAMGDEELGLERHEVCKDVEVVHDAVVTEGAPLSIAHPG